MQFIAKRSLNKPKIIQFVLNNLKFFIKIEIKDIIIKRLVNSKAKADLKSSLIV